MHEDENKFAFRRTIRDYGNVVGTNSVVCAMCVFVFLHQMWFSRFAGVEFKMAQIEYI